MKKLLAMLTTITSLSSTTPIILANASAEIPEKLNSNINLQENNLKNLNRVKRENNITNLNDNISNKNYYLNHNSWTASEINTSLINKSLAIATNSNSGVYFATVNGVYYMSSTSWTANKIGGINEPIAEITISPSDSVYFTAVSGNAYFLSSDWWTAVRIDTYYNVPEIKNVLSIKVTSKKAVYFSTVNGVYYMSSTSWTANKIGGINEPIAEITISPSDSVYFTGFHIYKKSTNILQRRQYNNNIPTLIVDNNDEKIDEQYLIGNNLCEAVSGMSRGFLNFINSFYGTQETIGIMNYLLDENIIIQNPTRENLAGFVRGAPYRMNNQNGHFIINVDIQQNQSNRRLQLVFSRNNFYLQGFIIRNGETYNSPGTYYHFDNAVYTNLGDRNLESRTLRIRNEGRSAWLNLGGSYLSSDGNRGNRHIGLNAHNLNPNINWNNIRNAFRGLLNYDYNDEEALANHIKEYLILVIFATSEAWRFNHLYPNIARTSVDSTANYRWNDFGTDLTSWSNQRGAEPLNPIDVSRINFGSESTAQHISKINLMLFLSIRILNYRKG